MNGHFDFGAVTPAKYFFSIAVVLGLLFAMISPDQQKPAAVVFLQWQLQTLLPMGLLVGSHLLLSNLGRFAGLNPWLALSISGIVGASLFAPLALLIDILIEGPPSNGFAAELFAEWQGVAPPVTTCWVALNAPWIFGFRLEKGERGESGERPGAAGSTETVPGEDSGQAGFMAQLPPDRRGRLLRLKSELHYLQVVTDRGSGLILYNLADAVAELPPESGIGVHRSHWVSIDAIEALERRGRQGELRLRDGSLVPVSRSRLAEVSRRLREIGRIE